MRTEMTRLGLAPDLVLISTARRTMETAAALEPWPDTPLIDSLDSLYLASADTLLHTLQEVPETVRSVLVVGHNPGLHELAMNLVGATPPHTGDASLQRLTEGYPSGALAEFSVPGPWHGLVQGGGRLVRFVCPKDLHPGNDGQQPG